MTQHWRTESEELAVEKTLHDPTEPPSLVTFDVTSTGDVPVMFRVVDVLPDEVPVTTTGFHPEYKYENWTLYGNGEVEFSDVIAPGESLLAFYYLQDDLAAYESEFDAPRLADARPTTPEALEADRPPGWRATSASVIAKETVIDGPLPDQLRVVGTDSAASEPPTLEGIPQGRDATADDSAPLAELREEIKRNEEVRDESVPSGSDPETEAIFAELQAEFDQREYEEFGDEVEQYYPSDVSFDELLDHQETGPAETHGDADQKESPAAAAEPSLADQLEDDALAGSRGADGDRPESVLGPLLRELDEYEFSEEERAALAEQFGLTTPRHTSVKVRHLQSEVADLSAYIDALEEFLDDNGTAAELLGTLEDDLESVRTRLDELETTVEDTAEQQSALADRIDTLEQNANATEDVREDLTEVQEEVTDNSRRVERMETKLTQLVNQVNATIESLEDSLSTQSDRVSSLERAVDRIEDRYARICSSLGSAAKTLASVPDEESDD